ncbi:equilibrative nucleoside transporter 1-like [Bolinopsis microptera]|uniref:equilibrative nucleoside transporter 1-like n=1 Tax=Bolinopsis microptera TaxID=2820187 RepID=UPI00307AB2AF
MTEETEPLLASRQPDARTSWRIYSVMILFGLASLLPWNLMITANGFHVAKFSETNSETIINNFPSYIEIVGIGSNFIAALLGVVVLKIHNLVTVVTLCNTSALLVFLVITVTAYLNTANWAFSFFIMTMMLFGVVMFTSAIFMSGMMGLSSILTTNAVQGFYLGQGLAGLFSALLCIVTLAFPNSDPVSAGFYYFLIASFTLLISLVVFVVFGRTEFVQIATSKKSSNNAEIIGAERKELLSPRDAQVPDEATTQKNTAMSVFKVIWRFCLTTVLTSTITSVCFPAALSMLRSSARPIDHGAEESWTGYFLPVTVFLVFSVGDVLGRITSSCYSLPTPTYLLPVSYIRLLLVPCIYMTNLHPRNVSVWFHNDAWAALFNFLLSWTNGHFISLAALYGPQMMQTKRGKSFAGTLLSFSYALGLLSGAVLVFPLMKIIYRPLPQDSQ